MGYTTEFEGQIKLSKPLTEEQSGYLEAFSRSRRMKRDATRCERVRDAVREEVGLPVGTEGEFCVFDRGTGVIDDNQPPSTQPGLWCQWVPTDDMSAIAWDENEKFYNSFKWLIYIHDNMLAKWGVTFTPEEVITYQGEYEEDKGKIYFEAGALIKSEDNGNIKRVELAPVVATSNGHHS